MHKTYTFSIFILFTIVLNIPLELKAQDVIIRKDGRVVHAKVYEVDITTIKYKRADFPEGPMYTILRSEVYSIAYENYSIDYFDIPEGAMFSQAPTPADDELIPPDSPFSGVFSSDNMTFSVGLGIITNYSKAQDAMSELTKEPAFPPVNLRILSQYNEKFQVGLQLAFGTLNFNSGEYNDFDEVTFLSEVKENVFSLIFMAKYGLDYGKIKPYALGGAGFNNSTINTDRTLRFSEDGSIFSIKSTARVFNLAIMLRGGADIYFTDNFGMYADIGTGISLLQAGAIFRMN
ncbi:MAG: outer membrane protein [Cyclobacteriaceae bacterium]